MGASQDFGTSPIVREDRIKTLGDYISKVARLLETLGETTKPVRIDSRTGSLEFSSAEIDQVRKALKEKDAAALDLASLLLAETIALRLKVSEDTKDLETAAGVDDELEEVIIGCLRQDLALAESLVGDYRLIIDQLFVADEREAAGRLGEFRIAVRQDMAHIRRRLLEEGEPVDTGPAQMPILSGADEAAEHLNLDELLPGEEAAKKTVRLPADPMAASRRRLEELRKRKRFEERKQKQKKRIRALFMVLGVALVFGSAELVLNLVPALQGPESVILTESDFLEFPVIIRVESTPPSALAVVNGIRWRKLPESEQRDIVYRAGKIAEDAAYNSIHLRDESGKLLGEWIRGVGTFVAPP
jgi:hypothetical protein